MIKWFSHIDITNQCMYGCLYCSRFERHIPKDKRLDMSLEKIEEALKSYNGFPNRIGIIGGEPLLHSQFGEVCDLLLKYGDKGRYGLWTSINPNTGKFSEKIHNTFGFIAFNEHNPAQKQVCKHQPLTLALRDMVENEALRNELTEQCYFRLKWCSTVNHAGAFHCEIAASIAYLFGIKGWDVTEGWWNKDWNEQRYLCDLCGGCIPQERQYICNDKQKISPSLYNLFMENNLPLGEHELVSTPYTIEYLKYHSGEKAGAYRGDLGESEENTISVDWSKYES